MEELINYFRETLSLPPSSPSLLPLPPPLRFCDAIRGVCLGGCAGESGVSAMEEVEQPARHWRYS